MEGKCKVLMITAAFATLGYSNVKAEQPTSVNPQPVVTKPIVETDEPPSVLTSVNENTESKDLELNYYDSNFNDLSCFNLNYLLKYPEDTIRNSGVNYYIKKILPIVKKLDSRRIEMIEIL